MEPRKDIELEVRGTRVMIPNFVFTILLIGLTAGLFMLLDDPNMALWGTLGLGFVMGIAKAVDVNMDHVLMVIGKTRDDLPDGVEPMATPQDFPTRSASGIPAADEEEPQLVNVRESGKIRAWLIG